MARRCQQCGTAMPFGRARMRDDADGLLKCNGCHPDGKGPGEGRPVGHHGRRTAGVDRRDEVIALAQGQQLGDFWKALEETGLRYAYIIEGDRDRRSWRFYDPYGNGDLILRVSQTSDTFSITKVDDAKIASLPANAQPWRETNWGWQAFYDEGDVGIKLEVNRPRREGDAYWWYAFTYKGSSPAGGRGGPSTYLGIDSTSGQALTEDAAKEAAEMAASGLKR